MNSSMISIGEHMTLEGAVIPGLGFGLLGGADKNFKGYYEITLGLLILCFGVALTIKIPKKSK